MITGKRANSFHIGQVWESPRGSQLARKLTVHDVQAMRLNAHGHTDKHQAKVFGVSASMVYKIRKGEQWGVVR